MKALHEKIEPLLPLYLEGSLDSEEIKLVEGHIEVCEDCKRELQEFESLSKAFEEEKIIEPSKNVEIEFLKALEEEKRKQNPVVQFNEKTTETLSFKTIYRIAAGVALLIGAFMMGRLQESRKSELEYALLQNETLRIKETAMLSLMDNQSASKRIQGVNYIEEFSEPDEDILRALTDRMLLDENTNVRMAAVEALSNFTTSELVKMAFVDALEKEKNPSVQIAIIKNLVRIQEKMASEPMKKLLEKEDTQPFIKEEIKKGLPQII
ncbi:zf-HC2 domain-containing protein [Maribacter litopenaei]|uniref:Zf-HC2 domain-containing protein n=1 Tax=Maribacter litopenaei TaxID=2976127 RepID=A0ABY5Y8N2_9FLAO|nr:zf-HC2 domain-containing protein [Maribacter litopenaei]UWX55191.1 zf-HC2 domain-containing protein [Maribacter litopenaei]